MTTLTKLAGYEFSQPELLIRALTHKSYFNESPEDSPGHNERLEFLGDAVLDLAVSDILMRKFMDMPEGELSKLRASLVNEATLAELAISYDFPSLLQLGKGERQSGGAEKPRLLASAFEAFIGAMYEDSDFIQCLEFIRQIFEDRIDHVDLKYYYVEDYKTRLQEVSQEQFKSTPEYKVIDEQGPDHDKLFEVEIFISENSFGTGKGKSKKQAEQAAAKAALEKLS